MKTKSIFYIHSFIEILAGLALVFKPNLLFMKDDATIETLMISKLYGIIAFFFGLVTFILINAFEYNQVFKRLILAIVSFHLVVAIHMFTAYRMGLTEIPAVAALHAILSIIFLVVYFLNLNKFIDAATKSIS